LLKGHASLASEDPDAVALAIATLPTEQQSAVEEELRDIYELSDDTAMTLIAQEAVFEGYDFASTFSELGGAYDVAAWALINHEELFAKVLRFRTADRLDGRFWRRRRTLASLKADVNKPALKRLSKALSAYLVKEEGRGHHCEVEYLRRSTGHLVIAYPEDYGDTLLAYEGDELVRRKIKPATDLLFFYSPATGSLEVYCRGNKQRAATLLEIFALTILRTTLPPDPDRGLIYELDHLIDPTFDFGLGGDLGVDVIIVKSLFLRPKDGGKPISIYPDGPPGIPVLAAANGYLALEAGEYGRPLNQMIVENARMQAIQRPLGKKRRGKSRTFQMSRFGCALDQEGFEGRVRAALQRSGIEREIELGPIFDEVRQPG
jgi:hypothetical protein